MPSSFFPKDLFLALAALPIASPKLLPRPYGPSVSIRSIDLAPASQHIDPDFQRQSDPIPDRHVIFQIGPDSEPTDKGVEPNSQPFTFAIAGYVQLEATLLLGKGVTQCPTATGGTFTYSFRATQYGVTWYHSHYAVQYSNGLLGPLLIHGPQSANWDVAWDPIILTDWVHDSAFAIFGQELAGDGDPASDTNLMQGHGGHFERAQ
ncbi:MAG: hypothetical protein Q9227_008221 [Pyrenula ochraceoflavens]